MTIQFHAAGRFNDAPNKYKAPDIAALKTADANQNMAGTGPVLYDGSGNAVPFTEASIISDGVANNNKQLYACLPDGGGAKTGFAQYSAQNSAPNDVKVKDWFSCNLSGTDSGFDDGFA